MLIYSGTISICPYDTGIDHAYLDVFGLEMAAGQNFRKVLTIPQTREGVQNPA